MADPKRESEPVALPVTLERAKQHIYVDHDDDDDLISSLIAVATDNLDGYTGHLGRCVVDQVWSQTFPCFSRNLELRLGDLIEVTSVTYFDDNNQVQNLPLDNVSNIRDCGRDYVLFDGDMPSTKPRYDAVKITYRAGWIETEVPAPIKQAILLMVGHLYENREAVTHSKEAKELPLGIDRFLSQYRIMRVA